MTLLDLISKPKSQTATVVVSRVPKEMAGANDARFTEICIELEKAGVAFTAVDSVYDMHDDDPGVAYLRGISGELVFLGWHYPRASKWILARQNLEVNGRTRKLHCIDIRETKPDAIAAKVKDILAGKASAVVPVPPKAEGKGQEALTPQQRGALAEKELPPPENAALSPRWYPVIDYDQCTNCMECMDFCLFGVYSVDHAATLRVAQQDQCRLDCPACSRVCPVGAIIFPKYETNQTIAGAVGGGDRGEIKLDLSSIFGKPKGRHQAALERDRELIKAGRNAVGT
ncbi:MAG TPA: ferredoxin family protein, partial [Planctomycetota bacterium]|nr:ferredoxin family protein [Planctomycetota bacterium]